MSKFKSRLRTFIGKRMPGNSSILATIDSMSEEEEKALKLAMDEDDANRPMTRKEIFDYLDNWWIEKKGKTEDTDPDRALEKETRESHADEEVNADGHRIPGSGKTTDRAFPHRLPPVRPALEALNKRNREFWKKPGGESGKP